MSICEYKNNKSMFIHNQDMTLEPNNLSPVSVFHIWQKNKQVTLYGSLFTNFVCTEKLKQVTNYGLVLL